MEHRVQFSQLLLHQTRQKPPTEGWGKKYTQDIEMRIATPLPDKVQNIAVIIWHSCLKALLLLGTCLQPLIKT